MIPAHDTKKIITMNTLKIPSVRLVFDRKHVLGWQLSLLPARFYS